MATQQRGLQSFLQSVGPVTGGNHPVIPHAHVNAITLVSWNRCFSTMVEYCFRGMSLRLNLALFFVYRITAYNGTLFNSRWCSIYLGFAVFHGVFGMG